MDPKLFPFYEKMNKKQNKSFADTRTKSDCAFDQTDTENFQTRRGSLGLEEKYSTDADRNDNYRIRIKS